MSRWQNVRSTKWVGTIFLLDITLFRPTPSFKVCNYFLDLLSCHVHFCQPINSKTFYSGKLARFYSKPCGERSRDTILDSLYIYRFNNVCISQVSSQVKPFIKFEIKLQMACSTNVLAYWSVKGFIALALGFSSLTHAKFNPPKNWKKNSVFKGSSHV